MKSFLSKILIIFSIIITSTLEPTQITVPSIPEPVTQFSLNIPVVLAEIKDLAHKYKLTPTQRTTFQTDIGELSKSENYSNLTAEQIAIFKEAINLALYGMVFEESFGTDTAAWTTLQTDLSAKSGTQAATKPTDNNFTNWLNFLVTEIGRYETLSADDYTKLLSEGKLTPIIGEDGFIGKLTNLVSRRMESELAALKTKDGTIQATTTAADTNKTALDATNAYEKGYFQLKSNTTKYAPLALEDPTNSWSTENTGLKSLINRTLRVVSVIRSANFVELASALNKLIMKLNQPITVDERILALKQLLDTMVISDKDGDEANFEIRLAKIIDSLSSAATTEQKKAVVDLIGQYSIIGKKNKDLFNDYIRILTQGRHPRELFKDGQKIAFAWDEIDGSEPKQRYWLNTTVTSAQKITLKTNDILDSNAQFKIKITPNAEVVIYKEKSATEKLILDNTGTLTAGNPESATDAQKFYVYGSTAALSFRAKDPVNSTNPVFGFLTVTFDKKLNCKINDKPAGKTNADGALEPGSWAIFKVVELGDLHERLSVIRGTWPTESEWTTKPVDKSKTILSNYAEQSAFMANSGLVNDANAFIFLSEISNFFQKGFRVTPEQWDWFLSSELKTKATELVTNIEKTMGQILTTDGQAKIAFQTLKDKLTLPPQATLEPHENAPKNGSVVTLFIQNGTEEKFMRVVEETDARGTHYFLKADVTDPVDPRCHLNVITQGNILAFSFIAPDNTKKTLQFVPRTEAELSRLWADEIGKNNIKIMSRLEFKEMGKGDINSKDRYNEQFQMDYVNKETKELVYNLDNIGQGAGILRIVDDYATVVNIDETNKKLNPTFKADQQTGIKILPISGFLTELGSLRNETDPIKVINGYSTKIDIAETNQDLEFLIMEFENFIEKTQLKRTDWLKLLMRKDFSEAMAQFLDKIKPKAETNIALTTALTNMKQTFVQTTTQLAGKTIAIKWTAPNGQEWYLKNNGQAAADFSSDNFADSACQFVLDYQTPTDPMKFGLKIKQVTT